MMWIQYTALVLFVGTLIIVACCGSDPVQDFKGDGIANKRAYK